MGDSAKPVDLEATDTENFNSKVRLWDENGPTSHAYFCGTDHRRIDLHAPHARLGRVDRVAALRSQPTGPPVCRPLRRCHSQIAPVDERHIVDVFVYKVIRFVLALPTLLGLSRSMPLVWP